MNLNIRRVEMKVYQLILFPLLLCFIFPSMSFADPLEDAKTAIEKQDFVAAQKLLLPLAGENNAEAQTLLGALYVNGQGGERDFSKGLSLIMKAATQGYKPARVNAFKLCLNLANQGDTSAMYNVGYMCLNDWGGEHDNNVCLKWLENAAKLGHEKSARILSKIYTEGMFGISPDKEKATYWNNLQAAFAAGINGKWEGSASMGMGGPPMKLSYDFKTDGDMLTGTTVGYGGKKLKIKEGKIEGINISFKVDSNFQGMKSTSEYTGMFLGDTLELSFTTKMGGSPASPPMKVTVKRAS
jgi:uncharacterized protein